MICVAADAKGITMTPKTWNFATLPAAVALFTMSAAFTPAFATKTSLGPTAEPPLLDQAIAGRCVPSAAKDVLRSYRLTILNAPTVEEARELILSQTGLARKALSTASWILPFSSSIQEARDKIGDLERRVYAANTQAEVANDFSNFLAAPADRQGSDGVGPNETNGSPLVLAENNLDQSAVSIGGGGGGGCNYTAGEIIIIILGFLLFIIPGIIFLILFC